MHTLHDTLQDEQWEGKLILSLSKPNSSKDLQQLAGLFLHSLLMDILREYHGTS
jgi:hypothetical protein